MTDLTRITKLVADSLTLLGQTDEQSQELVERAAEHVQEALDELRGGNVFAPHVDEPLTDALNRLNAAVMERTLDRLEPICVALRQAQGQLETLKPPKKVAAEAA